MSGFSINHVVMSGNLTRDPELRSLPSGTTLCNIGIAVNDRYKDSYGEWQDRANFFDWTVWGGLGEWLAANVAKGDGITLEGRARWHSWENDQGDKRSKVEFTADSIVPQRRGNGGAQTGRDKRMESENDYSPEQFARPQSDLGDNQAESFQPEPVSSGPPADDDIPF